MSMQADIWSITPETSATYYRAAASIGAAGALTLLQSDAAINGAGYKVLFTSAGDDTGITFTISGVKVGDLTNAITTEVVTGADTDTATSTYFYSHINSITASGASAGNVSIGTTGSLALPRTRIKSMYYVATATAGSIKITSNTTSGRTLVQVNTPGDVTVAHSVYIPDEGIPTGRSTANDFAIVTLTNVTYATIFCG